MKAIDITGEVFNSLTAIERDFSTKRNKWLFRCECGEIKSLDKNKVKCGEIKSCGCKRKAVDISGEKFNRLTAIQRDYSKDKPEPYWVFKCDCGNVKSYIKNAVMKRKIKSCGCLHAEKSRSRITHYNTTHGLSKSKTYQIWKGVKDRCFNNCNSGFKNYGGRGITMCDRWLDYRNFLSDMGDVPENMSIERIDNNGNYEPSNCKWADRIEQGNNRRNNRRVVIDGAEYNTVADACRATGLTRAFITYHYL